MFKKIVMFLACALIGIAALTPAQAAGQVQTDKKEVETIANKVFTATTLDAIVELEPYCAPGYVEYLNGQQIANKAMFSIGRKLVEAIKFNDAEKLSKTMVSLFTNDFTWKAMLVLMGAADPSMQANDEELQAERLTLISMLQSMSSQQKEMMLQKMKEFFKDKYNIELKEYATHGGLESGVFKAKMTMLDIVAYGPNMYDIHSPEERLEIDSFERVYHRIKKFLEVL